MKIKAAEFLNNKWIDENVASAIVVTIWVAVNVSIYILFGIQTGLESKKYIGEAAQLQTTGTLSELRYHFYFGIIGLLYIVNYLGIGIKSAVLFQLVISLAAHLYLFKSLKKISSWSIADRILVLILIIIAPSFEYWNLTLYSESVFFSAILFFIGACIKNKPTNFKAIYSQALLLCLCIISRPSGILLVIPWIIFFLQTNYKDCKWKIVAPYFIIGGVLLIVTSNLILGTIGDWNVMDPFKKGYVICNISVYSQEHQYLLKATSPIEQLTEFAIKYPNDFLNLTFQKIIAFFTQYRSYYSPIHNAYVIIYSLITLIPFTLGLFRNKYSAIATMLTITTIVWTISIVFQCDDYHSRFYGAINPVIILIAVNFIRKTGLR